MTDLKSQHKAMLTQLRFWVNLQHKDDNYDKRVAELGDVVGKPAASRAKSLGKAYDDIDKHRYHLLSLIKKKVATVESKIEKEKKKEEEKVAKAKTEKSKKQKVVAKDKANVVKSKKSITNKVDSGKMKKPATFSNDRYDSILEQAVKAEDAITWIKQNNKTASFTVITYWKWFTVAVRIGQRVLIMYRDITENNYMVAEVIVKDNTYHFKRFVYSTNGNINIIDTPSKMKDKNALRIVEFRIFKNKGAAFTIDEETLSPWQDPQEIVDNIAYYLDMEYWDGIATVKYKLIDHETS